MSQKDEKRSIAFGHLPKVEELLKALDFLEYSTQLRNMCYDLQYLFFLEEVLDNDFWYGGFKVKLQYERLKSCFNVSESLIFCTLASAHFINPNAGLVRFPELITKANELGFISDSMRRMLNQMRKLRNLHHAGVQRDLHTKFDNQILNYDLKFVQNLIREIKQNFDNRNSKPFPSS